MQSTWVWSLVQGTKVHHVGEKKKNKLKKKKASLVHRNQNDLSELHAWQYFALFVTA